MKSGCLDINDIRCAFTNSCNLSFLPCGLRNYKHNGLWLIGCNRPLISSFQIWPVWRRKVNAHLHTCRHPFHTQDNSHIHKILVYSYTNVWCHRMSQYLQYIRHHLRADGHIIMIIIVIGQNLSSSKESAADEGRINWKGLPTQISPSFE